MSTPSLTPFETIESQTHQAILDIANTLLDNFYEKSHSNAFGASFETDEEQGSWLIGRSNGDEGAENESGVDYIYRKPQFEGDNTYVLGKYGWMNLVELLEEVEVLRQAFEQAIEQDYLDEEDLERFDSKIEGIQEKLRDERKSFSLEDVATFVEEHDMETLRKVIVSDEEAGRVVWQMLFSKDEEGDIIENPVEVPVVSEDSGFMFVRSERYFYDKYREPDGKWYAYGVVIGYDDTDDVFFVHRLQSDPDLRDSDFEWTTRAVKKKMGFDIDYDKVDKMEMPFDTALRLQGDVALIRRDFRTVMWEHYDEIYRRIKYNLLRESPDAGDETLSDYIQLYLDRNPEVDEHSLIQQITVRTPQVRDASTDELKELQEDIGISEESVRDEQEARGINRLTSNRRAEIIEDLIEEDILDLALEIEGKSREDLQQEAEDQARLDFSVVESQTNLVLGNHTLIIEDSTEHPNGSYNSDEGTLATVIVPEGGDVYIWHDEHENKQISLPEGVYEFRFLEGYEDQWWMN